MEAVRVINGVKYYKGEKNEKFPVLNDVNMIVGKSAM